MPNNDSGGGFAAGFLAGGIIGVVVGILIAPKSGAETRAELSVRSEGWRTRAEELAATVRERTAPAVDSVRDRVSPAVDSVREQVAPVVDQFNARIGRGKETEIKDGEIPADENGSVT
jgi:gas vesicle protein